MVQELNTSEPQMRRYARLSEALAAHWGVPEDEIAAGSFGGTTLDGVVVPDISYASFTEVTRENGFWGFADTESNAIHYWVDETVAQDQELINFFAHEVAHLVLHKGPDFTSPEMELMCEKEATQVGAIAQKSFEMLGSLRRWAESPAAPIANFTT